MIYAIDEVQNHLPNESMMFAGCMKSTGGRTRAFQKKLRVLDNDSTFYKGKKGLIFSFLQKKGGEGGELLTLYRWSKDFWQKCPIFELKDTCL